MRSLLNKFVALSLISIVSLLAVAAAQPQMETDPAGKIVLRSIPQQLIDKVTKRPENLAMSFAVFDQWPTGAPKTIVTAYSNALGTAALVLKVAQDGTSVVAYQTSDLVGGIADVRLFDVDGDGVKEVVISFGSETGKDRSYIFRWDGSSLVDVGPDARLPQNVSFSDLYHDGTLALIAPILHHIAAATEAEPQERGSFGPAPQIEGYSIYHFRNGKFVFDRNILLALSFTQRTRARLLRSHIYEALPGAHGPYVLKIVNGVSGGKHRVASGRVLLNGHEVAGPTQLNSNAEFLQVPISLVQVNYLKIELDGEAGGLVSLTIE
jgi:hypothetical protein